MANDFARYIADMRKSFFDEQLLNGQFVQLEELETNNPGFVEDVCSEYFRDAAKFFSATAQELEGPHFNIPLIDRLLQQFKGSTTSVGAVQVTHQINCMRECLKQGILEECKIAFNRIKRENGVLQVKLENYFKLKRQGPPAEIEDRPEYGYMDTDSE